MFSLSSSVPGTSNTEMLPNNLFESALEHHLKSVWNTSWNMGEKGSNCLFHILIFAAWEITRESVTHPGICLRLLFCLKLRGILSRHIKLSCRKSEDQLFHIDIKRAGGSPVQFCVGPGIGRTAKVIV